MPLPVLLPPREPAAKWDAYREASKTPEGTERMIRLMRENALLYVYIPLVIMGVIAVVVAMIVHLHW